MVNICILDDDKELANQLHMSISEYLANHNIIFSADIYYDTRSLLSAFYQSRLIYHIYFLDIMMQDGNGIQVAKEIRKTDKDAHIIFLTSSPEYALEGYEVRAYNYLLKPLQKETLYHNLSELIWTKSPLPKQLQITTNGVIKNIPHRNIVYIEAQRNKLLLTLNTGEQIETYCTISELDSVLREENIFSRTHRSYIINMHYVKEITSSYVRLRPDYFIPVSRTYSTSVKQNYFAFTKAFFS